MMPDEWEERAREVMLTDAEIDAMPAGPELDDAIELYVYDTKLERGWAPMPYSTEFEWSSRLIIDLHKRGLRYKLSGYFQGDDMHYCGFDEQIWADANPLYSGKGDTPSLAICRAALKAVKGLAERVVPPDAAHPAAPGTEETR